MSSSKPGAASSRSPSKRMPRVRDIRFDDVNMYVVLRDGREFALPHTERLRAATPAQRANWRVEGYGTALHWPDIDEDIGLANVIGMTEDELYGLAGFLNGEEIDALMGRRK